MPSGDKLAWWQRGVFYNVYVRSFKDTNGDGVGDLPGVIAMLPYLDEVLGVDVLWLSGILKSPWKEFGFDISDFTQIHPAMGDLQVFDDLLIQAHRRGMKLLIDYVPNHTSDQHPWFLESRSSRDNPKRGWYIWADPRADGSPPNNWLSLFGGSAWEWDEATGQYYLHSFLKEQPDLNWRNPELKGAMFDVARFWLERGIDGFRVDAAHHIMKDPLLRDNPPNLSQRVIAGRKIEPESQLHIFDREISDLHAVYCELRALVDSYGAGDKARILVGEVHPSGWHAWTRYYGTEDKAEFHFPFNNGFISAPWDAPTFRVLVDSVEACLPACGWPNAHTGNQDEWRVVSRYGKLAARTAAMLLFTLRGTPLLYYGEEIGMQNAEIPQEAWLDPYGLRLGLDRDPQRTPMQWTPQDPYAGFSDPSTESTWLPVNPDHAEINVETELADPNSILNLYRTLIRYRREDETLLKGDYRPVEAQPKEVYAFTRQYGGRKTLAALNFADQAIQPNLSTVSRSGQIILSTYMDRDGPVNLAALELRPYEGLIVAVE